ncbi:GNAT family N-acetyltransferase [Zobellella iuensis]|uniref:GNAT family N-acetyltransferase n=1 Tax=Zobellella iuensis TaxID=2803811 RepID=A0ABS1QX11_9GAMM|nr:GNAT family N-acetyltransferase [Zobellella iuensis]MBL1379399.1 GNAT family N-acetyltransferase [Zobellella iuensis]
MAFEASYRDYVAELGDEERYPFPMDFDHRDFPAMLARINDFATGKNLPAGYVPSTTYWLVQGNSLLGVSNLRHYLNDRIRHMGGHIGLGIRPGYRGRGLGSVLLRLTIAQARARGLEEIHVHCEQANRASARMIVANGGVLDSEVAGSGGYGVVQRYLVTAP